MLNCIDGSLNVTLVGWRGTASLRAYTDTNDTVHLLRLFGADLSKYGKWRKLDSGWFTISLHLIYCILVVNKFQKKQADADAAAAAETEAAGEADDAIGADEVDEVNTAEQPEESVNIVDE